MRSGYHTARGTHVKGAAALRGSAPALRAAAPPFPFRVGAVDAGSNAIRFTLAEFSASSRFIPLEQERFPVRLGRGVFLAGRLDPRDAAAAVAALAECGERMQRSGVVTYRAVTTSAVREAADSGAFLARVRTEAGLRLEAISPTEEARLVRVAVASRVPLNRGRWVLADVGGGSAEVTLVEDGEQAWTASRPLGAVRLLGEMRGGEDSRCRAERIIDREALTLPLPTGGTGAPTAELVATGGNIEVLARMAVRDGPEGTLLPVRDLGRLLRELEQRSPAERARRWGLPEDRADVIFPAALIYARLAALLGVERIHVPRVGIRDGVLLEAAGVLSGTEPHPTS